MNGTIVLDFIFLVLIYCCLLSFWLKSDTYHALYNSLLYWCVCSVLAVTLMPFHIPWKPGMDIYLEAIHLRPFQDLMNGYRNALSGVLLNILLMVPLGFLLSIKKENRFVKVVSTILLFSMLIETVQLFYGFADTPEYRVCDITDVITNTAGGGIGFLLGRLFINYYLVRDKIGIASIYDEKGLPNWLI